jgi:hypothetical protein
MAVLDGSIQVLQEANTLVAACRASIPGELDEIDLVRRADRT